MNCCFVGWKGEHAFKSMLVSNTFDKYKLFCYVSFLYFFCWFLCLYFLYNIIYRLHSITCHIYFYFVAIVAKLHGKFVRAWLVLNIYSMPRYDAQLIQRLDGRNSNPFNEMTWYMTKNGIYNPLPGQQKDGMFAILGEDLSIGCGSPYKYIPIKYCHPLNYIFLRGLNLRWHFP